MSDETFGLHIGERYITASDVKKKENKYIAYTLGFVENVVNIYKSEGKKDLVTTSTLIQSLIKDAGIKKKAVNMVIPDTYSYSQIIEMPILTEKELLSAIKYQADQFIPVPIDEVNLDIEVLYEDKKNKKLALLLVASPLSTLDKIINSIETAGLAPSAIENETSASLRLISDMSVSHPIQGAAASPVRLFINFGYSSTSLYLFHQQANIPIQIHNFSLGYSVFLKDIQANFNTSETDTKKLLTTIGFSNEQSSASIRSVLSSPYGTIVEEIERFIITVKTRFNTVINTVTIFGEGCVINAFEKQLTTSLGMPVTFLDVFPRFAQNNVIDFFKNNLHLFIPVIGANLRP